ncbi:chromosome partitioning protein ParB [Pseudoscardovia radai]|uniref:Chromosome partitioning protein ParB n=1 Tax=Pseudoscardovia radai TaxID=987066 RepID=A0A261EQM3_9BIFI|nr:chromosome partitioning protein ParB [Pseudoscardovia radai]
MLEPIVVRPRHNWKAPYELIMGERRMRAAKAAGLERIPAIVRTTADENMLRDAVLENLHRVALNPLEEAAAYEQMLEDFHITQAQLAKSVSKSRSQITNTLRLLQLPGSVQKKVAAGVLSAGHARALLALTDESQMEPLAERIIGEGLSVRSTEEIVALKNGAERKQHRRKRLSVWSDSPALQSLENRFETKVEIHGSKQKGKIEITFSSEEDFDRIMQLMNGADQAKATNDGWV